MAKILFQGHGSLRLTLSAGQVIYIDPYAGEGYDLPADLVLVSHEHGDHNRLELVPRKAGSLALRHADLLQDGVYGELDMDYVQVRAVQAYNKNHPKDQCVGFVVQADGLKLYFAGDTSATEDMEKLLPGMELDWAFYPTDGVYNMSAEEASRCAKMVGAKHSVPIHMQPGELFSQAVADRFEGPGKTVLLPGEEVEL